MPKSKEFVEDSDSNSDGESGAKATSSKLKAKDSTNKDDVSNFREKTFYLCIHSDFNFY
jgi:hypothetical protein